MRKGRPPVLASGPFLCLLLVACGPSTSPTSEDSRELDNAEAMLNSAASELDTIDADELERAEQNRPEAR
jgi:hypothetical protein